MPATLPRLKPRKRTAETGEVRKALDELRVEQDMTRAAADEAAEKVQEAVRDLERE